MQRILLIFCCGLSSVFFITASITAQTVSLQESLKLALENSAQLKKAQLDRDVLEQRLREGRSAAYPQIHANLGFDYYPQLATQYLPGGLFGQADGTYVPVQFGQPWQLTSAITVEQPLYNESLRRSIPSVNVTRAIYDLLLERSSDEVLYNTAQLFYQTLQTEQLLRAVDANLDKIGALKRMAELQLKNGYAIPVDVKRIKVAYTNLTTQRQNLLAGIDALQQTMKFLCGKDYDAPFVPTEALSEPAADSARWQAITLETEASTEHRLLLRNLELNRLQLHSLAGEVFPTLNAYASGFYQTQRKDANVFDTNSRWYGMAMVGFRLQVPVFDGFRRQRKASILRIEGQKMEVDRSQLLRAKELEFRQARIQLQNSLVALRAQQENVGLAREIVEKLTLQYKEGVASLTDLLNAQTALSEAETNYWQQVFGYKLAVLKLLKAANKIDLLK
jgi:outer membrane protein TolC